MTDQLHLIDPDPRRGCAPGCLGCAQTEADLALGRRALEQRTADPGVDTRVLADVR